MVFLMKIKQNYLSIFEYAKKHSEFKKLNDGGYVPHSYVLYFTFFTVAMVLLYTFIPPPDSLPALATCPQKENLGGWHSIPFLSQGINFFFARIWLCWCWRALIRESRGVRTQQSFPLELSPSRHRDKAENLQSHPCTSLRPVPRTSQLLLQERIVHSSSRAYQFLIFNISS